MSSGAAAARRVFDQLAQTYLTAAFPPEQLTWSPGSQISAKRYVFFGSHPKRSDMSEPPHTALLRVTILACADCTHDAQTSTA